MDYYNFLIVGSIILLTSFAWFVYVQSTKKKLQHLTFSYQNLSENIDKEVIVRADQNMNTLKKELNTLRTELAEVRHKSYQEGYSKAKDEMFLNITPYYEEYKNGDNGFLVNDFHHLVHVGYKYQLYINNLPILEPTIHWEKIIEEKKREVDMEKVDAALKMIEHTLLPIVAQSNKVLRYIPLNKN